MAKFFKNYNTINFKVLKDKINNLDKEDLKELNIKPKYLAMTHIKHCDFCYNEENKCTLVDEIKFLFGYQVCEKCSEKNIGKTFIKKWYVDNESLPFKYFISNSKSFPLVENNKKLTIQRSSGKFEKNWLLDYEGPLKYIVNDNEDILIPIYKSYDEDDDEFRYKRGVNKKVFLSEICRFNDFLDEGEIINSFKSLFIKYQE